MDFDTYQEKSKVTRFNFEGSKVPALAYWALGLNGEAGELAEKIKKIYRDDEGEITEERKEALKKELGDCLWYLAQIAEDLGLTLEEAAENNIEKALGRKERGTLHGDGDDR